MLISWPRQKSVRDSLTRPTMMPFGPCPTSSGSVVCICLTLTCSDMNRTSLYTSYSINKKIFLALVVCILCWKGECELNYQKHRGKKDLIFLHNQPFELKKHVNFVFRCGLLTTVFEKITCESVNSLASVNRINAPEMWDICIWGSIGCHNNVIWLLFFHFGNSAWLLGTLAYKAGCPKGSLEYFSEHSLQLG